MSFGSYIRSERIKSGISLKTFSELIRVSQAYLSRIERDLEKPPKSEKILAMADALNIDSDDAYIAAGQLPYDMAADIGSVVKQYRSFHEADSKRKKSTGKNIE
jgi:transcriptional regulator with XRE-family HTH domain